MTKIIFVSDFYKDQHAGGAELTTEAIIEKCPFPVTKVLSSKLTKSFMDENKHSYWVFGNFSHVPNILLLHAAKNLNYSVIEYDYKFCIYRLPQLHSQKESVDCDCEATTWGKIVGIFFSQAESLWWMSEKQKEEYHKRFPFLRNNVNHVLSSVFSERTLDRFEKYKPAEKSDKWVILGSGSWVKGFKQSVSYAKENNLEYEVVQGLPHGALLDKLASSKGLIFLPNGWDTCPRIVIEAKLLGCELVLNDHVQHKDEDWFQSRKSTISHLRERKTFFQDNLWRKFYKEDSQEQTHFKIVLPCYNVEDSIAETIRSIKNQNYTNWECAIVDDVSNDDTAAVIEREIAGDDRFIFIKNKIRSWPCYNRKLAIESFEKMEDEDVIVSIDGDDKLMHKFSLERINFEYTTKEVMSTFGTWVDQNFNRSNVYNKDYSQHIKENSLYRSAPWIASAPRTYKYKLFKQIREEDFKNDNGEYWKYATDFAVFIPILEMCGEHTSYIPEALYVYNLDNPLNMHKVAPNKQIENEHKIRNRTSYSLADIDT